MTSWLVVTESGIGSLADADTRLQKSFRMSFFLPHLAPGNGVQLLKGVQKKVWERSTKERGALGLRNLGLIQEAGLRRELK